MTNLSDKFAIIFTAISVFLAVVVSSESDAYEKHNISLIGKIPGEFLGKDPNKTFLGKVEVTNGIISKISSNKSITKLRNDAQSEHTLELKNATSGKFDVIYPGLIDLHNHTKQNVLGVWDNARGQFENRFEWRAWGIYKKSVSGNMNPWISFGRPITCAAFRWSEIQAMAIGTTYLQGPSSCISNFGIHRVEDSSAYNSNKSKILAPTDVVLPGEMVFVWNTLGPLIRSGMTYEAALKQVILADNHCPKLRGIIDDVNGKKEIKLFSNKAALKEACDIDTKEDEARLPPKFIRYIYWIHKTIAAKKRYFSNPNHGALIAHLAEGRRSSDPYNRIEYEILKLMGLIRPNVNLVHGVGVDPKNFPEMAENKMGLIWSPYSNILLYGETLDIEAAFKAGVRLALGSDWLPTGTRGVLEELKVAKAYTKKANLPLTDRDLFNMVTKNPAQMINQEGVIGTLTVGAMGSMIAVTDKTSNPYSNLVDATDREINLVIIDGRPIYGNQSYLLQADENAKFEILSKTNINSKKITSANLPDFSQLPKNERILKMASHEILSKITTTKNGCNFVEPKGLIFQNSLKSNRLIDFKEETGLNLDRFESIQKLLALGLVSQSRNLRDKSKGDLKFIVKKWSPLYSCDDRIHSDRISNMISTEMDENIRHRNETRKKQKLGSVPRNMTKKYNL